MISVVATQLTPGGAVLVGLMEQYRRVLLDPFLTMREIHKLMYFAQEADEPLRLQFVKGSDGPVAENLEGMLAEIEGHFAVYDTDGAGDGVEDIALAPGSAEAAAKVLASAGETRARFDRVAALIEGFESSYGMELLATVHWIAAREGASDVAAVEHAMGAWWDRERVFSRDKIAITWDALRTRGWLEVHRR